MDKFLLVLGQAWASIKSQLPAIVMAILSYEEIRVKRAELERDQARLDGQREKNKSEILEKYATGSDADVLRRAIREDGGTDADLESVSDSGSLPPPVLDRPKGDA